MSSDESALQRDEERRVRRRVQRRRNNLYPLSRRWRAPQRIIIRSGANFTIFIPESGVLDEEEFIIVFDLTRPEGLTAERINSFPLITSSNDCAICLQSSEEDCRELPCSHLFHSRCIDRWFERNTTCPLCRENFGD